jgi:hypothetical protein
MIIFGECHLAFGFSFKFWRYVMYFMTFDKSETDAFLNMLFLFLQFFQIVPGIRTTAQGYYI